MAISDAEQWRARHRDRGERYRWLKAIKAAPSARGTGPENGFYFMEQDVDDAVRALVHTTTRAIESPEFGLIEAGATEFSVMPDETYVGRMDKIILTDRQFRGEAVLTRGGTTFDALPNAPIVAIAGVWQGDTAFEGDTDYALNADRLEWLDNAPAEGESYTVEYRYQPTYECLGPSPDRMPRPDKNGVLMPLRVLLTLKAIGDE